MLAAMLNAENSNSRRRSVAEKTLQEYLQESSSMELTSSELTKVASLSSSSGNLNTKVTKFMDWGGVRPNYLVSVEGAIWVF